MKGTGVDAFRSSLCLRLYSALRALRFAWASNLLLGLKASFISFGLWSRQNIDYLRNSDFLFPVVRKRGLGCIVVSAACMRIADTMKVDFRNHFCNHFHNHFSNHFRNHFGDAIIGWHTKGSYVTLLEMKIQPWKIATNKVLKGVSKSLLCCIKSVSVFAKSNY